MSMYLTRVSYMPETRARLIDKPEDRRAPSGQGKDAYRRGERMGTMKVARIRALVVLVALIASSLPGVAPIAGAASGPAHHRDRCSIADAPELLVSGMASGSGSTIGPRGALYVTEGKAGRVLRVNPKTGDVTTFAEGLPKSIIGIGGAMDVAFIGKTAYVLVTLVGPDVGGTDIVGIYRVDGPNSFTVIADIGAFSLANPPKPAFFVPTGVQYAIQTYHGGFLVTDGHHNRVLRVKLNGSISEVIAFGNIVPTGIALSGDRVYMSEAGPIPHLPQNGKIITFKTKSPHPRDVASGGRLLVDVEFGPGHRLYGLAQGVWPLGNPEGSPALPNTGQLLRVKHDGTFAVVADVLNQPTSLEFIRNTAYVVTLGGEIWTVGHVSGKHHCK